MEAEKAETAAQTNQKSHTPALAPPSSSDDTVLQQLVLTVKALQTKIDNKDSDIGSNKNGSGKGKKNTSTDRLYCWTHGACAHNGKDCKHYKDGHQVDTTFQDMNNGSTKNCYWIKPSTTAWRCGIVLNASTKLNISNNTYAAVAASNT